MLSLIMAHAGGKGHGRENSVEAVTNVSIFSPDIIELDVRKSRDGILFCFHGSVPFGFLGSFFIRFFNFTQIHKWFGIDSLETVVQAIQGQPILFLDIWQTNVNANDIKIITKIYPEKNIWIASRSLSHLKDIRVTRGDLIQYVLNRGMFFLPSFELLKQNGVNIIKLFSWQCRDNILQKLKENNIAFGLSSFLLTKKQYIQRAEQYNSLWICYDKVPKR